MAKSTAGKKVTAQKSLKTAKKETVASSLLSSSMPNSNTYFGMNRRQVSLILGILVILALLYMLRGWFIVATVNGQPISRLSLVSELEKQGGKQTLNTLVTKSLIQQEASKKRIVVSSDEVNTEIKRIQGSVEKQGQNFDQLLSAQGMTKDSLAQQVKLQKELEKLVGSNIVITDKEVDEYINTNKSAFPEGTDVNSMRGNIKEQLKQKKMNEKIQSYLEDLRKKAQINYFVNY